MCRGLSNGGQKFGTDSDAGREFLQVTIFTLPRSGRDVPRSSRRGPAGWRDRSRSASVSSSSVRVVPERCAMHRRNPRWRGDSDRLHRAGELRLERRLRSGIRKWRTTQEKAVARRTAQNFGCSRSIGSRALTGNRRREAPTIRGISLLGNARSSIPGVPRTLLLDWERFPRSRLGSSSPKGSLSYPSRANRCSRAAFSRRKMPRNSAR